MRAIEVVILRSKIITTALTNFCYMNSMPSQFHSNDLENPVEKKAIFMQTRATSSSVSAFAPISEYDQFLHSLSSSMGHIFRASQSNSDSDAKYAPLLSKYPVADVHQR